MKAGPAAPRDSAANYYKIPAPPAPFAPAPFPVGPEAMLASVAGSDAERLGMKTELLEVHFEKLGDITAASLDDFGEAGAQLAQALQDTASGDLAGLADLVGLELTPTLGSSTSLYFDAAAPDAAQRLGVLAEVLDVGSQVMAVADGLAAPLEWGRGIVATIGKLLDAMNPFN